MKLFLNVIILFVFINSQKSQSQTIDTLVDVGKYKLHFNIIKGKGIPILFESGGGDIGTIWNNILKPISDITRTTLISYDRAGFGKSTVDSLKIDNSKPSIVSEIEALEIALQKLGYNREIMLVAHSYGGNYVTMFASKNSEKVKSVVLIDATLNDSYIDSEVENILNQEKNKLKDYKKNDLGRYYMATNLKRNVEIFRKTIFPPTIPVISFVSDIYLKDKVEDLRWKTSHKQFVDAQPNRIGITAYGCGHYIFLENPPLIINAIVKSYSKTLNKEQSVEVLNRGLTYAVEASNEVKKQEIANRHSEEDLNTWGYLLIEQVEMQKALEVFKLNVLLNPSSSNAYDSYGEILLKENKKEEAIKMYKKSIELNPKNENGKKVLEEILK